MTTSAALSIRLAFAAALGPEADPPITTILFLFVICSSFVKKMKWGSFLNVHS
jgi:hypothetical protein